MRGSSHPVLAAASASTNRSPVSVWLEATGSTVGPNRISNTWTLFNHDGVTDTVVMDNAGGVLRSIVL